MMEEKTQNRFFGIVLLAFFIVAITWGLARRKAFKESHVLGIARIHKYSSGGRGNAGGIWIDYFVNIDGVDYKGSSRFRTSDIKIELLKLLWNRTIPVLYNPENPTISLLLLLPENFKEHGYSFPDSLRWILPYIKK